MIKILVVEDDSNLNLLTAMRLRKEGYEVLQAYNGIDALNLFIEEKADIIISDIMMPLCDGFELARRIREIDVEVPIIFLTARDDKISKQFGYQNGIDDYIVKPFDLDELAMKINSMTRRMKIKNSKEIVVGNFKMILDERSAYLNGEEISFTTREFDILFNMLSNPKKTYTRGKLMEDFWDFDSSATSRTVDVYMAKIREKIKDCDGFEIQTVHGLGYKVVLK